MISIFTGGYKNYAEQKQRCIKQYQAKSGLGPMKDEMLNAYLEAHKASEDIIIQADKVVLIYVRRCKTAIKFS